MLDNCYVVLLQYYVCLVHLKSRSSSSAKLKSDYLYNHVCNPANIVCVFRSKKSDVIACLCPTQLPLSGICAGTTSSHDPARERQRSKCELGSPILQFGRSSAEINQQRRHSKRPGICALFPFLVFTSLQRTCPFNYRSLHQPTFQSCEACSV